MPWLTGMEEGERPETRDRSGAVADTLENLAVVSVEAVAVFFHVKWIAIWG